MGRGDRRKSLKMRRRHARKQLKARLRRKRDAAAAERKK
jgi:hypothetical protein